MYLAQIPFFGQCVGVHVRTMSLCQAAHLNRRLYRLASYLKDLEPSAIVAKLNGILQANPTDLSPLPMFNSKAFNLLRLPVHSSDPTDTTSAGSIFLMETNEPTHSMTSWPPKSPFNDYMKNQAGGNAKWIDIPIPPKCENWTPRRKNEFHGANINVMNPGLI